MKKLVLLLIVAAGVVVVACNKQTILPSYTQTIYFTANSKMSHASDTVSSKGDTLWLTAGGTIKDTSRKYGITGSFKTADSVNKTVYATLYVKTLPVTFVNAAPDDKGFFKWSATVGLPVPAVAAKTRFYSTATFAYSTYGSSQMGNVATTDSRTIYAK